MRRGRERATATTVSLPETRNWWGNDNTTIFHWGKWVSRGKRSERGSQVV